MILEIVSLFVLLLVFGLGFIVIYNNLIKLRNRVENGWAQIDVQLKRRNDLIPNLVETVKGYADHEKSLFEEVTKARAAVSSAQGVNDTAKASDMLTSSLKSLFAVAENYPELKANQNFIQLQNELAKTEDKIAYSRQFYNDVAMKYNTSIETIPNNIVAGMKGFERKELFEAPAGDRNVPEVKF